MRRKKLLTTLFTLIMLLSAITVTYAYFSFNLRQNDQQNLKLTSGTMELTFADSDNSISKKLNFDDSISKKFTIENTGTLEAVAKISWKSLLNTYLDGSLVYSLSYSTSEDGPYIDIIDKKSVPRMTTAQTVELANGLVVPANTMYYYILKVTLKYSNTVDQTSDLKAGFSTSFIMSNGEKSVETVTNAKTKAKLVSVPTVVSTAEFQDTEDKMKTILSENPLLNVTSSDSTLIIDVMKYLNLTEFSTQNVIAIYGELADTLYAITGESPYEGTYKDLNDKSKLLSLAADLASELFEDTGTSFEDESGLTVWIANQDSTIVIPLFNCNFEVE